MVTVSIREKITVVPCAWRKKSRLWLDGPGLEKILKQAVPDEDFVPSRLYKKLMELPWCDVFTTNYDTLLERTADQITNRRYNVVVCQEDLVNSSNAPRIVKLHGSFPSHRPFIITEEDCRTYPVKFAPDGEYRTAVPFGKCFLHDWIFL